MIRRKLNPKTIGKTGTRPQFPTRLHLRREDEFSPNQQQSQKQSFDKNRGGIGNRAAAKFTGATGQFSINHVPILRETGNFELLGEKYPFPNSVPTSRSIPAGTP